MCILILGAGQAFLLFSELPYWGSVLLLAFIMLVVIIRDQL